MKKPSGRRYTDLRRIIYLIAAVCCIVFLISSEFESVLIKVIFIIVLVGFIYDFLIEKFKND